MLLIWGAGLLVRGAGRKVGRAGISPLVIGLTVVALGTSAPELAVSLRAALVGQADLTLVNVMGSNIANMLLIIGLAALVTPLLMAVRVLRREVPTIVGTSLLLWLLVLDGSLGRLDGALLVVLLGAFLTATAVLGRRQGEAALTDMPARANSSRGSVLHNRGFVLGGLLLLVVGGVNICTCIEGGSRNDHPGCTGPRYDQTPDRH